ncbi:zf-DHHC-domain-containing protein [Xylariaceae sp. FL0255]|nr:zf-DHHC-domain-containing protein [Xylariaceae sp. FL0255]
MAFLIGSSTPILQRLAVPFACILIIVLGYGSQILFATSPDLAPGPLTSGQTRLFNALIACLWWTYYRACTVDPGRYQFPRSNNKKRKTDSGKAAAAGNGNKIKEDKNKDGRQDAENYSSSDDDVLGDEEGQEGEHNEDDKPNTKPKPESTAITSRTSQLATNPSTTRRRWCRKCCAPKPPRAHHCKTCNRCIPKMDHHCPWTSNCVSLQTFPHFLRFLLYTNLSLFYLQYLLFQRWGEIYASRHLPAYLGPSLFDFLALGFLTGVGGITTLLLVIMLVTSARGWVLNMTMIETWEIDRHEAVLRRAGRGDEEDWWREDGEDAPRRMLLGSEPVEFPYDLGFWENMAQGMGSRNPLEWILPFGGNPRVAELSPNSIQTAAEEPARHIEKVLTRGTSRERRKLGTGWFYEENGLNDCEGMWPPVDPEKVRNARLWRRRRREYYAAEQGGHDPAFPYRPLAAGAGPGGDDAYLSPEVEKEAFRRRQEIDLQRWRGRMMDELEEVPPSSYYPHDDTDGEEPEDYGPQIPRRPIQRVVLDEGRSGWVNTDGEHLGDYGVDEDAEFADDYVFDEDEYMGHTGNEQAYRRERGGDVMVDVSGRSIDEDDEDVPLAELIRRRKTRSAEVDA